MHGVIFTSLRNFVLKKTDESVWREICTKAEVDELFFSSIKGYPDAELTKILVAASEKFHKSINVLLEEFGEFLLFDLMELYKHHLDPHWDSIKFLSNIENIVHQSVRKIKTVDENKVNPPELLFEPITPDELMLTYCSPRKLCPLAKGLIRGTGQYYHERLKINELSCMHKGETCCRIHIKRQKK